MLKWFRRRQEAARLAQTDAAALVRELGGDEAYWRALEIARHGLGERCDPSGSYIGSLETSSVLDWEGDWPSGSLSPERTARPAPAP
jgi:hypothetical protein